MKHYQLASAAMNRSALVFIAGLVVGFGLGCCLMLLVSQPTPSAKAVPAAIARRDPKAPIVRTSPQALLDVVNQRPESVSALLITFGGSSVELKSGVRLMAETVEQQQELQDAARKAGVPFAIE
ncbi:MAG TPA: hypothetical protein VFV87_13945 [Pirellulaceae bacterium]|nr:hypothetical protein [Pirellulaceae bacterium]